MKLVIEILPRYDSNGNLTLYSAMGIQTESHMALECITLRERPLAKLRDHQKEISIFQKVAIAIEKEVEAINQGLYLFLQSCSAKVWLYHSLSKQPQHSIHSHTKENTTWNQE